MVLVLSGIFGCIFWFFSYGQWTFTLAPWLAFPLLYLLVQQLKKNAWPWILLLPPIFFGLFLVQWQNYIPAPRPIYQFVAAGYAILLSIPWLLLRFFPGNGEILRLPSVSMQTFPFGWPAYRQIAESEHLLYPLSTGRQSPPSIQKWPRCGQSKEDFRYCGLQTRACLRCTRRMVKNTPRRWKVFPRQSCFFLKFPCISQGA